MADVNSRVEIGYLEKSDKPWILESRYFPSKVGGKPAWLDLKNISLNLSCGVCSKPCVFLCQLYAPVDDQANAYHRTVFVFVCKNPECNKARKNDNFIVLRCQLPQKNKYYAPEEPNDDENWHTESKIERFCDLCVVCGCAGNFQCGKCKSVKYCSKEHQVLDWRSGHNETCAIDSSKKTNVNFLFPEYGIIIEKEEENATPEKKIEKSEAEILKEYNELVKSKKAGTMLDISPEELENYALSTSNKFLKNFKQRLSLCPDQVVRYDKGNEPLWIEQPEMTANDIPICEACGGPRQFEFQILPTLLSYLDVDQLGNSLDWGNLLIYTCKNNCESGPAYKKEFLWKQDIL